MKLNLPVLDQNLRNSNFEGQTKMAARGGITQAAMPKFLWGTPQTLSYKPTNFHLICSAGPFLAQSSNSSEHPFHYLKFISYAQNLVHGQNFRECGSCAQFSRARFRAHAEQ